MKIFSNFDTHLPKQLYEEAVERYGQDHVCFISRDSIYLRFKVYSMAVLALILLVVLLMTMYVWTDNSIVRWSGWIGVIILVILMKILLYNKLIDYYLDFTIVSPNHITSYDQEGIFQRNTKSIDMAKIKSINVEKKGLLCSVFNYGSIIFFSEGDEHMGDIALHYIYCPLKLRNRVAKIVNMHHRSGTPSE